MVGRVLGQRLGDPKPREVTGVLDPGNAGGAGSYEPIVETAAVSASSSVGNATGRRAFENELLVNALVYV